MICRQIHIQTATQKVDTTHQFLSTADTAVHHHIRLLFRMILKDPATDAAQAMLKLDGSQKLRVLMHFKKARSKEQSPEGLNSGQLKEFPCFFIPDTPMAVRLDQFHSVVLFFSAEKRFG